MLERLRSHLQTLANLSPDGVREKNHVGFSGSTIGPGFRLLENSDWSMRDALTAVRICVIHRTQLGIDAAELLAEFAKQKDTLQQALTKTPEQQLEKLCWSEWRDLKDGRHVRTAAPTQSFWAMWREHKDAIKKLGISVSQWNGAWQVNQWRGEAQPSSERSARLARYERSL